MKDVKHVHYVRVRYMVMKGVIVEKYLSSGIRVFHLPIFFTFIPPRLGQHLIVQVSMIFPRIWVKPMMAKPQQNGSCIYFMVLNIMLIDNPEMQECKTSAHINGIHVSYLGYSLSCTRKLLITLPTPYVAQPVIRPNWPSATTRWNSIMLSINGMSTESAAGFRLG